MSVYELAEPLVLNKCYYITGTLADVGGGESVLFEIGDNISFTTIGTVSANGGFVLMFTYTGAFVFAWTHIRITVTGTVTISNLKLRLEQQCSDAVCSECYRITDCEPPHEEHLLLEWTNNEDGLGFTYSSMVFNQSLYIVGGLRNADYPYEEELFQDSIQQRYPVHVVATKIKELWIHDLPEYIHDAIRVAVVHDEFYVQGVRYVKMEGGYSPDWDTPNSLLAPCVVSLTKFSQDTINDNCA